MDGGHKRPQHQTSVLQPSGRLLYDENYGQLCYTRLCTSSFIQQRKSSEASFQLELLFFSLICSVCQNRKEKENVCKIYASFFVMGRDHKLAHFHITSKVVTSTCLGTCLTIILDMYLVLSQT